MKEVTWTNFLSTGNNPVTFTLDQHSTVLIGGPNGSGKSTIMDAICFALYNKPFRKITKPQLVNTINNKKCLVSLTMNVDGSEFKVTRGIKPTVFVIEKNGKAIEQDANSRDYQDYLEKQVLKMSFKTFCQVVVLGSANWEAFMSLSAANRRRVIEDLLDIEVFSTMNILLKERQNALKDRARELDKDLALINNTLELNQQHRESLKKKSINEIDRKKSSIDTQNKKINQNEKAAAKLTDCLLTASTALSQKEPLVEKRQSSEFDLQNILNTAVDVNDKRAFFEDNDICPTCSQGIDSETRTEHLIELGVQNDKLEMNRILKIDEIAVSMKKLKKFDVLSEKINSLTKKLHAIQMDTHVSRSAVESLTKEIKRLSSQADDIIVDETEIKQKKKTSIGELKKLSSEQHLHIIAANLLKDNGIKTQIIRQYIPIMNTLINKYLERLDFFCQFSLNENFEEQIKARYKDAFTYESFSQGEKARIDLALLFTWRAIAQMRNTSPCNLLILDEVFDGSLDISGAKNLIQMIVELTKTNIIIISHTQSDEDFDHVITVEKQKNFSKYNF